MSAPDALFTMEEEDATPSEPAPKLTAADLVTHLRAKYNTRGGNGPRYIIAPEVRNCAGFGGYWSGGQKLRTADLIVADTWHSGPARLIGHEIKVSRSDWLNELKDPDKAAAFTPHVAEWWLVVADRSIVHEGELPHGWGLLAPNSGGWLHTFVKAARKPQPPIPVGLLVALLRRVHSTASAVPRPKETKP